MPVSRHTRLAVIGDIHGQTERLGVVLDCLRLLDPLDGILMVGEVLS